MNTLCDDLKVSLLIMDRLIIADFNLATGLTMVISLASANGAKRRLYVNHQVVLPTFTVDF